MITLPHHIHSRGLSLVEMLVTIAVFALVFGGLFTAVQYTLKIMSSSKATTSALSLANERLEYIRSLTYNSIGTVSGIPNGPIPQNSTTTLNGITFSERVLIQYIDSPDDGEGALDENGILADYKQVKVEYSWSGFSGTSTIFLLTNIVPPGIESTTGGGTLTVNVFDAGVLPVSGASVHIYNDTTTTTIDTTQFTNVNGIATFAGAPAAANYEITVTKAGYSTDQTYTATTSNPNPATLPVAVLESAVSTMNFQIDELSDLMVRTIEPPTYGVFTDTFTDSTLIGSSTNAVVVVGDVELSGGAGSYASSGSVFSTSTSPTTIERWNIAEVTSTVPAGTTLKIRVYDVSSLGEYTLVSDTDLSGNSAGFTTGPIDLSLLSVAGHPSIALGAELTSSDVSATPLIHAWSITHIATEPIIGNISFTLTGAKVIGTALDTAPIYKYSESHSTDAGGDITLSDLEWDSYSLELDTAGYDIAEVCADLPFALDPGVSDTLTLTLAPETGNNLRVSVVDDVNVPVSGAVVEITRPSFSDSGNTSACGQIFFDSGLANQIDYEVQVSKSGYISKTVTDVTVEGDSILKVILTPS
ncbi:MAG: prepilin-type N-terminal cleavage/methylation domain-containing protein [Candidatus Kaiserbacteria bacterium]|nr:prepilin-type N-terminal cleavage/methylation domain-containing protein [Candidatus Kaiserbacteria bacterium]